MQQELNTTISGIYATYLEELEKGDLRVKDWLWMDTPFKTAGILLTYLILLRGITSYMKDKKPFDLKWLLIVYNSVQVVGSFYVFAEILLVAIESNYSMTCQEVDYSRDPLPMRVSLIAYFSTLSLRSINFFL